MDAYVNYDNNLLTVCHNEATANHFQIFKSCDVNISALILGVPIQVLVKISFDAIIVSMDIL